MMEEFKNKLWRYLRGGRVHPALILSSSGPQDTWTLGKGIAKHFLCKAPSDTRPFCGECNGCRKVDMEIHLDVILVRELGEDHIKIETIRDLCEQMVLSPMEGRAKLVLIDRAHRMNLAASNAFLKTLEEPLPDRYFVLLTHQPRSLLPTVLSRCMQFRVPLDSETETPIVLEPELEKLLTNYFSTGALTPLIQKIDDRDRAAHFVSYLMQSVRNGTVAQLRKENMDAPWNAFSTEQLLVTFDALSKVDSRLRSNANYGLMLEAFFRQHL